MRGKYKHKKQNKYKKLIFKYRNRPDLFAEEILGVKLLWYQKVMLRTLYRKER